MKVILRENVENLGKIGDVVKVSDGYARNFLLPRNLVIIADETNLREMQHHEKALARKRARDKQSASEVAKRLEEFSCTIARKVGEGEKIFGSVTANDIVQVLSKEGFLIDRRQIHLDEPIKQLGVVSVPVKLQADVTAQLKVWVVQAN